MKIPDGLLVRLREDLVLRRISSGIGQLDAHRKLLVSLRPEQKNSATLLGYLAQWVDVGFEHAGLVKELVSRFPKSLRAGLHLTDYVHLRMAEGLVSMVEADFEQAIQHFTTVLSLEDEIQNKELVAITHFWIGRCHRRGGRYHDSLGHVMRGQKLASELKYPRMAGVMQVLEGWIAFQEERPNEALRILGEAYVTLSDTDDYITLGNIQSAYGRIARRQGRFQHALTYFEKAIGQYQKRDPEHNNIARSLVNIAHVKRLIALQLRTRIDSSAARNRKAARGKRGFVVSRKIHERGNFERLHEQARAHLADVLEAYGSRIDHRGLGGVHIIGGYLSLDEGELDHASSEAATAFQLGVEKRDYVLQARARILQSVVEAARFEEQLEEPSGSSNPAQSANDYAREAVEYAKHTQSRRLLAKAYIALGITISSEFFEDPGAAQQYCDKAASLLNPENQDYVWAELQTLKQKLFRIGKMDSTFREWSQGLIGDKTFQQISEQFAEIIIPIVWKREGCKISRVADRLSISPKKVRRILRNVGVLGHQADPSRQSSTTRAAGERPPK